MDSVIHEDLTTIENISPFLKQCVGKGKEIPTGNILQVQQVTNVSFPTYDKPAYDSDKHTLKITVTDGQSQGYALVPDGCPGISTNTAPGTKIRTTQPIPVQGSLFVLSRNNCEVIGGKVAKLYEKWEIQKKMAIKHEWGYTGSAVEGEGPPPWKPFGYKPSIDVSLIRKMKTTDVANNRKDGQGGAAKSQFDMQRDETISGLQATANKQKFQKPNKHLLDKEITDIMEEGFTQTEAENAMNRFKNTQKALKYLKDAKKYQEGLPREPPKPIMERKDHRRKKGKGNDEDDEQEVPVEYQRPTKSISLFGFIEGQIKADEKPTVQNPNGPPFHNYGRRTQDLEDGIGRLNFKDSRNDSYYGRNEHGRGRGGYRGGGYNGPRDRERDQDRYHDREPYQQQRYENKGSKPDTTQRPPRFQNRGVNEGRSSEYIHPSSRIQSSEHNNSSARNQSSDYNSSARNQSSDYNSSARIQSSDYNQASARNQSSEYSHASSRNQSSEYNNASSRNQPSDYNHTSSRNQPSDYNHASSRNQSSGGNYDSYRGSNRDNYENRSYPQSSNPNSRQDYSGGYQSQQQQRPTSVKDRSHGSDYHQQQYQKSNDYPVPSQNYQQSYPQHQQQQQQQHSQGPPRQYSNNNSQSHENMGYRGQQRAPPPHYSNHSSGSGNPTHPEFTHYQYGYEGWNPTQSLVFTRSKGDSRGRGGGYPTSSRGAPSQNNSYNSRGNNRY